MSIRTERTITKIGNSAGITLPAEVLAKLGVNPGEKVHLVEMDGGNFMITAYDPDFEEAMAIYARESNRYKDVFKALADA